MTSQNCWLISDLKKSLKPFLRKAVDKRKESSGTGFLRAEKVFLPEKERKLKLLTLWKRFIFFFPPPRPPLPLLHVSAKRPKNLLLRKINNSIKWKARQNERHIWGKSDGGKDESETYAWTCNVKSYLKAFTYIII